MGFGIGLLDSELLGWQQRDRSIARYVAHISLSFYGAAFIAH